MDQTTKKIAYSQLENGRSIAFIQANWHREIVDQARESFINKCESLGIDQSSIDLFEVPGSLEIPLQAKLLAKSGEYAIIVAAGLIIDGGIYRHDFVASTVLDAMMDIQLELEVPILSVVLTPHQFQDCEAHKNFFFDHFKIKGVEAADACAKTLKNLEATKSAARAA